MVADSPDASLVGAPIWFGLDTVIRTRVAIGSGDWLDYLDGTLQTHRNTYIHTQKT